jgi:hypothetical protein
MQCVTMQVLDKRQHNSGQVPIRLWGGWSAPTLIERSQ